MKVDFQQPFASLIHRSTVSQESRRVPHLSYDRIDLLVASDFEQKYIGVAEYFTLVSTLRYHEPAMTASSQIGTSSIRLGS